MKEHIPYIILTLVICLGSYFLLQQNKELKGLKAQQEIITRELDRQKEENTREIDSLNRESKKELIEAQSKSIDSLTKLWNNRPKTPAYDKDIDKMRDADSISKLFNRFYPDTNNP